MANGSSDGTIYGPDLSLTPTQQNLLRTALSSNNPDGYVRKKPSGANMSADGSGLVTSNGNMMPVQQVTSSQGDSIYQSPIQDTTDPIANSLGLDDSPFIDGHDYDDANFDWDNADEQLFGDLLGAPGHEEDGIHDKRKNNDEGDNEDRNNKRHEGNEKHSKKPGRKPLNSSEPTTVSLAPHLLLQLLLTAPIRNAKHRIVPLRELSVSAKNVI